MRNRMRESWSSGSVGGEGGNRLAYPAYTGRIPNVAAKAARGRVEMWRGFCRSDISVSAPFVWRCLSSSTVAPFPHPAHRTGHADLPHPALGQDLTPLLSRATPSAVSEPSSELIGCPISRSPTTSCVCLELRSLPSISITRPQRYYEPLRHPGRPACTLALPPIRDTLIEGFSHFVTSMTAPIASGWSGCRVGLAPTGKRRLSTAHANNGHPIVDRSHRVAVMTCAPPPVRRVTLAQ